MSLPERESSEDVESLVNTLSIEGATLTENNLSLTTTDLQRLAELSQELNFNNSMETEEVVIEEAANMEEEIVETEIGAEEVEIETETERQPSPEEILPDVKGKISVPPLRPLTIAPKPTKVPITLKPLQGGQQLLLVQGQSLTTGSGQTIKLLSPQGQEINLANLQLGRPIKPANTVKTITATSAGNISVVPQKQLLVRKVISPSGSTKNVVKPLYGTKPQEQHFMVVQKAEPNSTTAHVKLVPNSSNLAQIGPTKTITLQQAQEMGLLTNAKYVPQTQPQPKATLVLNKGGAKTLKLVSQVPGQTHQIVTGMGGTVKAVTLNPVKSPTKILPAQKGTQHIIYKKPATGQSILPQAQVIQVAGTQALNAGQLHQINIPGKGVQYIKFVPSTTVQSTPTSTITLSTSNSKPNISLHTTPGGSLVFSELGGSSNHSNQKNIKPVVINKPVTVNTQVVMLPYLSTTQANPPPAKLAIPKQKSSSSQNSSAASSASATETKPQPPADSSSDSNGMRTRKPCNCTKSQCLKLYCDCFANGEFCYQCKCMYCYNNLENEEYRQRAIKACLERNPNAFRPKIGKAKDVGDVSIRKHTKGCNCKRSGCLKNYCECYEAKIACSSNCKCIGCRNIEESLERKNFRSVINNGVSIAPMERIAPKVNNAVPLPKPKSSNISRQAVNFITLDVIEATCQCLLSVADKGTENMQDVETTSQEIIEEFGRCLNEIIEHSTNRSP
ncbi:protein lin-54 homolog isoform X2 [Coccinella septempunctata]|uniref:protein lin-54 homolog isoform X2 n=1 Tax=Coccinella septempunctata TaxID=41139 RepID=UPI001D064DCE|nr:protein lin-54 homolog isoform X2 [Coccinella septempunctata]